MMTKINFPQAPLSAPNLIGGKWKTGNGPLISVNSPYNGKNIGSVYGSNLQDVQEAVSLASKAQLEWQKVPLKERCKIMFAARELLLQRMKEISHVISSESGKTLAEAEAGLSKGVEVLEFAISLQNLDMGGRMEVSRGVSCEYQRHPLGVVAGITPFNFPAMVPMWMIPIAMTLGNAFLWKPSDKTPLTSQPLAQVFKDAGLPDGILTIVHGGAETVEHILDHPQIKAVGFVGSTKVARKVYQRGTQHGKRVLALGGAKNHIILMPDADPEMAAQGIVDSFTGCAGQRCMASSVLLAVGKEKEVGPLLEKIYQKAKEKVLGSGMGAIISKDSLKFLVQSIERAGQDGAKLLLDGRNPLSPNEYDGEGNWLAPTILDHVSPQSQAAKDELFGPILSIIRCENLTKALEIENQCPYGNAASVFTSNGAVAEKVAQEAKSGMIGVNIGVPVPREPFSFGGIQESKFGHGDITGHSSLDFWSSMKKVTRKWTLQKDQGWMS